MQLLKWRFALSDLLSSGQVYKRENMETKFFEKVMLHMPISFPSQEFSEFLENGKREIRENKEIWKELGGSSNLVAWRYKAAFENMNELITSWKRHGAHVDHEGLYRREKYFFGWFINMASCIESTCYGCFSIAALPTICSLPFSEEARQKFSPRRFYEAISTNPKAGNLAVVLQSLLSSEEFKVIKEFRNTMTHRSNIPRINFATIGGPAPQAKILQFAETWSTRGLIEDESYVDALCKWFSETVKQILIAGSILKSDV